MPMKLSRRTFDARFEAPCPSGFVCAGGHIIKRLSAEVSSALKNPAVMERITELGAIAAGGTPAKLAQFQRAEQEKWGKVIQAAKIKAD